MEFNSGFKGLISFIFTCIIATLGSNVWNVINFFYIYSLPVEWFVEELQTNPELARIIVHKFVDADQDGELTAEELLRPMY